MTEAAGHIESLRSSCFLYLIRIAMPRPHVFVVLNLIRKSLIAYSAKRGACAFLKSSG